MNSCYSLHHTCELCQFVTGWLGSKRVVNGAEWYVSLLIPIPAVNNSKDRKAEYCSTLDARIISFVVSSFADAKEICIGDWLFCLCVLIVLLYA